MLQCSFEDGKTSQGANFSYRYGLFCEPSSILKYHSAAVHAGQQNPDFLNKSIEWTVELHMPGQFQF